MDTSGGLIEKAGFVGAEEIWFSVIGGYGDGITGMGDG